MTMDARNRMIDAFSNDPAVTVFLMSLKAGGVALNLTAASHVMLMDPWCGLFENSCEKSAHLVFCMEEGLFEKPCLVSARQFNCMQGVTQKQLHDQAPRGSTGGISCAWQVYGGDEAPPWANCGHRLGLFIWTDA